jgi:hypothetical protein
MIFHAATQQLWKAGDYRLYWGIRGWDAARWDGEDMTYLGRELTISEAMKLCESDASSASR